MVKEQSGDDSRDDPWVTVAAAARTLGIRGHGKESHHPPLDWSPDLTGI